MSSHDEQRRCLCAKEAPYCHSSISLFVAAAYYCSPNLKLSRDEQQKQSNKNQKTTRRRRCTLSCYIKKQSGKQRISHLVASTSGLFLATLLVSFVLVATFARQTLANSPEEASRVSAGGPVGLAAGASRSKRHSGGAGCQEDCLAIPMIAKLENGEHRVSGFLLHSAGPYLAAAYAGKQAARRKQRENAKQHQTAAARWNDAGDPSTSTAHYYSAAPATGHPAAYSGRRKFNAILAPRSDEKCPMTGALTVCDQIGSYPADVILGKLEIAKRARTFFNIDSFFSDERDHLAEPFKDAPPPQPQPHHRKMNGQLNITTARRRGADIDLRYGPPGQYQYAGGADEASVGHTTLANNYNERQPLPPVTAASKELAAAAAAADRHTYNEAPSSQQSHSSQAHFANGAALPDAASPEGRRRAANLVPQPPANADEFVFLVERQAIRAANRQRTGMRVGEKTLPPLSNGGGYPIWSQGDAEAAARALNGAESRRVPKAAAQLGARGRRETRADGEIKAANGDLTATIEGAGESEKALKLRARRQLAPTEQQPPPPPQGDEAVANPNSSAASAAAEPLDPERVSDALQPSDEFKPEPVCRAKSIYISPKAAVSRFERLLPQQIGCGVRIAARCSAKSILNARKLHTQTPARRGERESFFPIVLNLISGRCLFTETNTRR